jgi:hypothetical protein
MHDVVLFLSLEAEASDLRDAVRCNGEVVLHLDYQASNSLSHNFAINLWIDASLKVANKESGSKRFRFRPG